MQVMVVILRQVIWKIYPDPLELLKPLAQAPGLLPEDLHLGPFWQWRAARHDDDTILDHSFEF